MSILSNNGVSVNPEFNNNHLNGVNPLSFNGYNQIQISNELNIDLNQDHGLYTLLPASFSNAVLELHKKFGWNPNLLSTFIEHSIRAAVVGRVSIELSSNWVENMSGLLLASVESGMFKTPLLGLFSKVFRKAELEVINLRKKGQKTRITQLIEELRILNRTSLQYADIKAEIIKLENSPNPSFKLFFKNATVEALEDKVAEYGAGVCIDSEGQLWANIAGRYHNGISQLDTILTLEAGDTLVIDRKGLESKTIDNPAFVGIFITQPEQMSKIVNLPEAKGRGLLNRFTSYIQKPINYNDLSNKVKFETLNVDKILNFIYKLILEHNAKQIQPVTLLLTQEAEGIFEEYRWNILKLATEELSHYRGLLSKSIGQAIKIAASIAIMNLCEEGCFKAPDNHLITAKQMQRAIKWQSKINKFNLKIHGTVFIRFEDKDEDEQLEDIAKQVLEYIKRKGIKEFTARDLQNKIRRIKSIPLSKAEEIKKVLDHLVFQKKLVSKEITIQTSKGRTNHYIVKYYI